MNRPSFLEAVLIGSLAAVACLCAVRARGEAYSIVAQSDESTAATGRPPLAWRIASARLPHVAADGRQERLPDIARRSGDSASRGSARRPGDLPGGPDGPPTAPAAQRSSGNGLSSSRPAAVTR